MKTILLIIAVIVLAVGFCQPTLAQTERGQQERTQIKISPQTPQKQSEVVTITGKHRSLTVPPLRIPAQIKMPMMIEQSQSKKPAAMSMMTKMQIIGGKGTIGSYATLSLKNLSVAGKAEIRLLSPLFIETDAEGTPLAWFGASLGFLALRINAESANSIYFVDCGVDSNGVTTFSITENVEKGNTQPQYIQAKNGHLLFLLNAPDAGWYDFAVSNEQDSWTLYSCQVSSLK